MHFFYVRHILAQSLIFFPQGVCRIRDGRARWLLPVSFWLDDGRCYIFPQRFHAAFNKAVSPDHNQVRIADVIDCGHLTARQSFTVLMAQHLLLKLLTVHAAFGA